MEVTLTNMGSQGSECVLRIEKRVYIARVIIQYKFGIFINTLYRYANALGIVVPLIRASIAKFTSETSVVFHSLGELCIPGKYFINTIMLYWCKYHVLNHRVIACDYIRLYCIIV